MILQAHNIELPSDIQDFMTYAHAWYHVVHEHHKTVSFTSTIR